MLKCEDCGREIREDELTYKKNILTDDPYEVSENVGVCPHCGSHYLDEMEICPICGDYHEENGSMFCDSCLDDMQDRLQKLLDSVADDNTAPANTVKELFYEALEGMGL